MAGPDGLLGWLGALVAHKGSDLYITHAAPPMVRVYDELIPLGEPLTDEAINKVVAELTTHEQQGEFAERREFNMSLDLGRLGRFRVNMMQQRQHAAIVVRRVDTVIPTLAALRLPPLLGALACARRGLIVMVGGTGSGKSTSLAAMIDHRNETLAGHILTIEDPIEYVHSHKKSLVTQREVGVDTKTFDAALKNALRQKPDAILIGEIRDREVMRHALNICETGHLALATLHANNADQAIERMANFFDTDERRQVALNLSFNLKAILSQRLVRTRDGGRTVALEILLATEPVKALIRAGATRDIKPIMASRDHGMCTFDASLMALWRDGHIDATVALAEADDPDAMAAMMAD